MYGFPGPRRSAHVLGHLGLLGTETKKKGKFSKLELLSSDCSSTSARPISFNPCWQPIALSGNNKTDIWYDHYIADISKESSIKQP